MSVFGVSMEPAGARAPGAQSAVAKARERARAAAGGPREFHDLVDLRLAEVDSIDAAFAAGAGERDQPEKRGGEHPGRWSPRPPVDLRA